ncbi:LysR family transcriptional regulator [Acuticoccus sp. MNP-M23]|uniref:LysR family transcriptional regulator n=1 Tax=Acuticoccus sp. MNP-M23 TaxID=3072793 RepID=UPI002815508E|nr:LysR family transcriptional regulator [Acuticoccus sp. MNP-M23]WMS42048.1 LysR family transcriptional regulator [Acuticoccus sp. MNP-M23]
MEIKQLRYFQRVADTGSVSRAAAALSVAQPAVSRQIANLEETLGTALFFRNGRGVTLTDAGQQLYGHTARILESIRHAEQDVRDSTGAVRGTILLGSMPSVVRILAPTLLKSMGKNHPSVFLEFTTGMSGYVNEWLSNGLLDVAILHDATRTQHFLTEPLIAEELVAVSYGGDKAPVAFKALAGEPLILPRKSHGLRLQVERAAAQLRVELNVRYELDSLDTAQRLVSESAGVAILPKSAVQANPDFVVRQITDPQQYRQLLLATSSQRSVSQATRVVINELKRQAREMVGTANWPGTIRVADYNSIAGKELVGKASSDNFGVENAA